MARLHHRSIGNAAFPKEPIQILGLITDFLEGCKRPAVLEAGADLAELVPGQYTIEVRAGRVWIECWSVEPSLSRRILAIESRKAGALTCSIHRFGGKPGSLTFLDLDRAQTSHRVTAGFRQSFSEQFRQMLFRQFPGWEIPHLSTSPDLRRSFSPRFPRARLVRGNRIAAAMACPSPELETEFLSFALLWFDHIRAGAKQAARTTLSLFLPDGAGNLTAHRLRWLREDVLQPRLFLFNEHGSAGEVDPQDLGNLETRVASGSVAASGEPSFSHVGAGSHCPF